MNHKQLIIGAVLSTAGVSSALWWSSSSENASPVNSGHDAPVAVLGQDANSETAAFGRDESLAPVRAGLARAEADPLAAGPSNETSEISLHLDDGLEPFMESFRTAMMSTTPYASALPAVSRLARALSEERKTMERGSDAVPLMAALDAQLVAAGTEQPFVQAALLVSKGLSLPIERARELGSTFSNEGDGEVARAAMALRHLSADGGLQLGLFQAEHSKAQRASWPLRVEVHSSAAEWMQRIERRQSNATPRDLAAAVSAGEGLGFDAKEAAQANIATTELMLLVGLGGRAADPAVRAQLLRWAEGSDGSHAAIWSLCHAAAQNPELRGDLTQLLQRLDPGTAEFALLVELMIRVVKCPELAVERLEDVLVQGYDDSEFREAADIGTIRSALLLSKMMASDDPELREQATGALINVALQAEYPDDLRLVVLYELAGEAPARIGEALELILIQPDRTDVKLTAAVLASAMPPSESATMGRILKDTYVPNMPVELQEAYARGLMTLGGDDGRETLRLIQGENQVSSSLDREISRFLEE